MNLIVDIGNSTTKLSLYRDSKKLLVSRINEMSCEELEKVISGQIIKKAIVSSGRELQPFIHDLLFRDIPFVHLLSHKSRLPFKIEYETPETLGTDRIAGVAGAWWSNKPGNIMIIDAGTAITYDFLAGNIYRGGNISPGINIRFKALNEYTGRLPVVERSTEFSFPGRNTTDAIRAGVVGGVAYEINEYIRTFKKEHDRVKVIITGGDAEYLMKMISHKISYMPDIVADGLNYILEYNAK
jgi:type III pantothenate kinase